MYESIDFSGIEILTVSRKYTRRKELYALACNLLPNIKNVVWRIYLNDKDMSEDFTDKVVADWELLRKRISELSKNTDNVVIFEEVRNMAVGNAKGNYFATVGVNSNRWSMSVDDDYVFPVRTLYNIAKILALVRDPVGKLFLYSTIDIWNARGHEDYQVGIFSVDEAMEIAHKYGYGVLPHLRIKSNVGHDYANYFMSEKYDCFPTLLPVHVGSGGFIVHPKAVPDIAINSMLNFNPYERGHDIQFASYFKEKYLLCDCEVWHTGVEENFFNDDWQSYNEEALNLYKIKT